MSILITIYIFFYLCIYTIIIIASMFDRGKVSPDEKNIPLSIVIPSYDETDTILDTIESIVDCKRNFPIEIIVVDDGLESETTDFLKDKVELSSVKIGEIFFKSRPVREVYEGMYKNVHIYVVDKENGRKADALNAGVSLVHFDYFICLDADSVLDSNALLEIERYIDSETLAIGGRVRPVCINSGNLAEIVLNRLQIYEYNRNFVFLRKALDNLNCVTILSGAFSLFKKSAVMSVGGFDTETKGEDFEITLKMQKLASNFGGTVRYCDKAVVYTQTPFNIKSLYRQRSRWHQGMLEVFCIHRYGSQFGFGVRFMLMFMKLYEGGSCWIESVMLLLDWNDLIRIAVAGVSMSCLVTIAANCRDKRNYANVFGCFTIFYLAFHCFLNVVRLIATIIFCIPAAKEIRSAWERPDRRKISFVMNG